MSACSLCGQKGLLVSVDERGMCKTCHQKIQAQLDKHLGAIRQANTQMHQPGVDIPTQIRDCDIILNALEELHVLEQKGVKNIMQQPIDAMLQQAISTRRQLVEQAVKQFYAQAKATVDSAKDLAERIRTSDTALAGLQHLMDTIGFSPLIQQAQDEFRRVTWQAEYKRNALLGENAENQGALDEAHAHYTEAEMYLKKLETDKENMSPQLVHLQNHIQTILVMIENAKPRRDY